VNHISAIVNIAKFVDTICQKIPGITGAPESKYLCEHCLSANHIGGNAMSSRSKLLSPVILTAGLSALVAAIAAALNDEHFAVEKGVRPSELVGLIRRVRVWLADELACPDIHGAAVECLDADDIDDDVIAVALWLEMTRG